MKRELTSTGAAKPGGPYSQAVEASGAVYCSGQLGVDPATGKLEEGIVAQTRRALTNIREVLTSAGLSMDAVVKTTVFLSDLSQFGQMNEEYARHFKPPYPARSTVQAALPKGALIEIDATASR